VDSRGSIEESNRGQYYKQQKAEDEARKSNLVAMRYMEFLFLHGTQSVVLVDNKNTLPQRS
jgi:hypothetical protein